MTTLLYSKKIASFINEILYGIKKVLSQELKFKVFGDRFYNKSERISFPIKVVVYNDKKMLGYFDSHFYEMGFHEKLMTVTKEQLHNIIRHELAHYILFVEEGPSTTPHSPQFRSFCRRAGWGEEVFSATTILETQMEWSDHEESSILRKVKKLMALSSSHNTHESQVAWIKSQQLLLKHHIDLSSLTNFEDEEKMYLKRVFKQKTSGAKMRAITQILSTFFVRIVHHRGSDGYTYLEILGTKDNVDIGDYVTSFLDKELDKLWKLAQLEKGIKGVIAKNSFLLGIAKGYCEKIDALKKEYSTVMHQSVMVIEKQLADAAAFAYPNLSTRKFNHSHCALSSSIGEQMGKDLTIKQGVTHSTTDSFNLISY